MLLRRSAIVAAAFAGGIVGSLQGDLLNGVAYAAGWAFVVWAVIREPAVLLIAVPTSAVFGLFAGTLDAGTSGAFLGTLTYWAVTEPNESLRRRFSLHMFDELINEQLTRPILIFLLAFPFMLIGMAVAGGAGYLIAGDTGGVIGLIAGVLLGFIGAMRYFDRVHALLAQWQLVVLAAGAVVVSLMWDRVPGGLVVAVILYVAIGLVLIIWSRPRNRK